MDETSSRPNRDVKEYSTIPSQIESLTKREREVIALVAQGLRTKQIAYRLSISEITLQQHFTSIFTKLEVADRFEMIVYAYRHKLCEPPG